MFMMSIMMLVGEGIAIGLDIVDKVVRPKMAW
jgi:hypothetical protein